MSNSQSEQEPIWAPGTVTLEDIHGSSVVLFPTPSDDPDDPLNWSKARKALNYTFVSLFVLFTFVELDIGFTAWGPMETELGFTVDQLNAGTATNYGGLAVGCFFLLPLARKYGRRPIYIFSSALQLAASVWNAKTYTFGDYIGGMLISGLGGAISEIIVQMTVADLFFVHQHATMNGLFVLFQSVGAFLGPVASGYVVESQGWRWGWWWCVIFFAVMLLCVIFLFEESKFIPILNAQEVIPDVQTSGVEGPECSQASKGRLSSDDKQGFERSVEICATPRPGSEPKTYLQRMALVTPSDESIWPHMWQPVVILFTFPAVTYTALTYGSTLCWFAVMTSLQATYMILPPYNFSSVGIGLMNVAPFIGSLLGFPISGYLSDKSILWLSKRNNGIYEPEMRLWLSLPIIALGPASILMFGLGLAYGAHWVVLAVGYGIFGFVLSCSSGISLSYLMDCYQDIVGDTLVGVVFMRNVIAVIVLFTLTPWVNGMGMQNLHILIAVVAFFIYSIPIPLLIWGKRARIATASTYRRMAENQSDNRVV
ncbi:sugar transporter [Aspergillus niger]|uniref:Sugar transporter n=1 Tax=Aspergillus niger TaxID=5061 RepID=A0A100IDL1_ASPNG|nr:sugar transporter [Aspergillus niger]